MSQAVVLRQRLAVVPDDAAAAAAYGRMALASGDGDVAAIWLGAAAGVAPCDRSLSPTLATLGHAYLSAGLWTPAAHALRRAAISTPDDWQAWSNYGVAEDRRGDTTKAAAAYRIALVLSPDAALAATNLADLMFRARRHEEAARIAGRAGDDAEALVTVGNALLRLGKPFAAMRRFRRAVALSPFLVAATTGLGSAHMAEEQIADAGAWWRRTIALVPDDVSANNNLATWHLAQGDLARGFALYEWRWRRPEAGRPRQGLPEWQGEPIGGRRLLVYPEQGLGDALQMARFVPELARRGAAVELECGDELRRLFASLAHVDRLLAPGEPTRAELQVPLMSLPRLLATTLATIPRAVPYLAADAALIEAVAPLLPGGSPRVGLVWQGNPRQVDEPYRSVPLAALMPLLAVPGVRFFGLQRDHGREQMGLMDGRENFIDLGPRLNDLATTAAVMTQLDLVITPCTATAHLAGALGRPAWILLKRGADWRWMLERNDSPWYPTATLIRQRLAGDWQEVGERVASRLRSWLS